VLDRAKAVIRRAPGFEEEDFRWPVEKGEITFSSKQYLPSAFGNVFDGRGSNIVEEQEKISAEEIGEGDIVKVAYTPSLYRGKKATKTDPEEYKGGVTFHL